MNIAIFGLGYVGCVSAACLAKAGHEIIGMDVNPVKVDIINQGFSPVVEKDLDGLISDAVRFGRLRATIDASEAVRACDISLICVGTPSCDNGSPDLQYILRVSRDISKVLSKQTKYHVVAVRSTVMPGAIEEHVIPLLESYSGKRVGVDFGICSNPEFLREGSAVDDFLNPPFTLIGEYDTRSGDLLAQIYNFIDAPVERTSIKVAEMMKYVSNAFHVTKICFANEIGNLCKVVGIDSHEVMRIFCNDTKLNISTAYLKPGYAFGGSCLPKDIRALCYKAKQEDLELPLLQSLSRTNELQARRGVEMVIKANKRRVGILGLSFKPGTDDLRESPIVYLVESLVGKGYQLKIYDGNVSLAKVVGANKQYIEKIIPHISSLLCTSLDEVVAWSEVLVVGNQSPTFIEAIQRADSTCIVIDLVRLRQDVREFGMNYQGIAW